MPADAPPRLDYAPPRPFLRRRWKRLALVALLLLVATAAFVCRARLSAAYARNAYLRLQDRCLDFAPPPGRVVFDETGSAPALLASPGYAAASRTFADDPPTVLWHPEPFKTFWPSVGFPSPMPAGAALLFMHERTTPAGHRHLLCVLAWLDVNLTTQRQNLVVCMYEIGPATWGVPPTVMDGNLLRINALFGPMDTNHPDYYLPHKPLRIFAGQADPDDPSHFTIDYETGGQRATLDGYMRDRVAAPDGTLVSGLQLVPRPIATGP
jgi:hypothetical protein